MKKNGFTNQTNLGYTATVPANSTRYFSTFEIAVNQPTAKIDLVWDSDRCMIRNCRFDGSLIVWDNSYCTSIVDLGRKAQLATFEYFEKKIVPFLGGQKRVVDIGCGQGEFVEALHARGFEALGYDPALKGETQYLLPRLWSPAEKEFADLFVMRCVLPHIEDWESFLDDLFHEHPSSMVLVEFQSFEWVIANGIWQQLGHDHVNIFTTASFSLAYKIVAKGSFAGGEWEYVLLGKVGARGGGGGGIEELADSASPSVFLDRLMQQRGECLMLLENTASQVAIWGAAGKGQVLSHALHPGQDVFAVDAYSERWSKFLEASGVQVFSPEEAMRIIEDDSLVLVSNPRHFGEVVRYVDGSCRVYAVDRHLPGLLRALLGTGENF